MSYDDDNIFAKILRGEIPNKTVYEDDHALAFHDIEPQAPVHVLVIPKGKYIDATDFAEHASAEEQVAFNAAVIKTVDALGLRDTGYRLLANTGRDSHQLVPHYHVHVFGGAPLGHILVKTP